MISQEKFLIIPKSFGTGFSSKTKTRKIPSAIVKDESSSHLIITDPQEKATLFNDYFNSVFSHPDMELPPPGIYPIVPQLSELYLIMLSSDEVCNVLCKLDPSRSPGPDEVTMRLLKELALELASPLTCLFNQSLASGQFHEKKKCKDANLTPVHKSGAKNSVNNYRGIALLSVASKVLERCVYSRIYNHVAPHLSLLQHGFRYNRSCVAQLI